MPAYVDTGKNRLALGQGLNRASLPQTPPLIPEPPPNVPHIRATPERALPSFSPTASPAAPLANWFIPPTPPPTAPTPPARLSPPGFAIDLTPKGKKADLAGRGAAMLMRGDLAKQLVREQFPQLGPGEKKALATLHSPEELYNPKNQNELLSIIRPGPIMQHAIESNPALQHNREVILGRIGDVGTGQAEGTNAEKYAHAVSTLTPDEEKFLATMSPAQRKSWIKTTYEPANKNPITMGRAGAAGGQGALSDLENRINATPAPALTAPLHENLKAEAASFGTGVPAITQKFATGAAKTMIGVGPGLVNLATHDPRKTLPALGRATLEDYKSIIEHPDRQFQQDPFNLINSTFGVLAGGAGAIDRAGAVGSALAGGERGLEPLLKASMTRGAAPAGEVEQAGIDAHKLNDLRAMAKERQLPSSGTKQEVFNRLVTHERAINEWAHRGTPIDVPAASPAERITNALHAAVFGRRPGAVVLDHRGVRVTLPASKSAIGRAAQQARYEGIPGLYKGLLQRLDHHDGLINDTLSKVRPGIISADAKFGRALGKQGRLDQDLNSALSTYMMSRHMGPTLPATLRNLVSKKEDISAIRPSLRDERLTHEQQAELGPMASQIAALARGNHVIDLHHALWSMGENSPDAIPGKALAVRFPDYKEVKPESYGTEAKMHDAFSRIAQYNRDAIKANPGAYRYVHQNMFEALRPFNPKASGPMAKSINAIDRATQLVRAGRFLHPGYLAWAVQNGMLHLSQAGMFALRNAWQLHNHYHQWSDEAKAIAESGVGAGMARATTGETPFLRRTINSLGSFWHSVDDRPFRMMSLLHEMNREGIHTAAEQEHFLTDPSFADSRRAIFQRARNEAIDYSAMTPTERDTLKKMFTAYGWTRGASAFTARFPFEHPLQQQALSAVGRQGSNMVDQYYAQHGGMPPAWLRAADAITGGNSPKLLQTGLFNPSETLGRVIGEIPGLTHGQTESLSSEVAPMPQALLQLATGTDQYGNAFKGNQRLTGPIAELAKRFEPWSAFTSMGKKGGSTVSGPGDAAMKYLGIPITQLRDVNKTASLGQKDFEQSLSRGELINFRAQDHIDRIPQQVQAFETKTGAKLPPSMIARYKGAVDTIEHIQQYQQHYAGQHGSKSYKSLPAENKIQAAISYMQQNGMPADRLNDFRTAATHMTNDTELEQLASALWQIAGKGATEMANAWQNGIVKTAKPKTLTAAQ